MKIKGGCYCGRIRYEALPETRLRVNCHCTNCRKSVGGQAVAYVIVSKNGFSFIAGKPKRYETGTNATRTFCDTCGSSLTYEAGHRPHEIDIVVGSLDNPGEYPPEMDYYFDEKVSWVHFQTDNIQ